MAASASLLLDAERAIVLLRGQRVMLSHDLAALYGVEPRVLMQAVKRNAERFPDDFMFQLNNAEVRHLKSQLVTSKSQQEQSDTNLKSQIVISSWGGGRANPHAFTSKALPC